MLASLITAFVSGEAMEIARRARTTLIIYVLVAILALTGIGFLVGAGYIAAANRYGNFEAALGFGVGFLVIAVVLVAARSIVASSRRKRDKRRSIDLATIVGAAAVTALPMLLRSKGGVIAPLIAAVAYMVYRENRKNEPDDRADSDP